jgi:hypothetical protein
LDAAYAPGAAPEPGDSEATTEVKGRSASEPRSKSAPSNLAPRVTRFGTATHQRPASSPLERRAENPRMRSRRRSRRRAAPVRRRKNEDLGFPRRHPSGSERSNKVGGARRRSTAVRQRSRVGYESTGIVRGSIPAPPLFLEDRGTQSSPERESALRLRERRSASNGCAVDESELAQRA